MDWQLYVVPAGLLGTYGAYAYHRYDTIRRDGRAWLGEYLQIHGRRDRGQLVTLTRAVFPDLLISYFDATDAEEPPPLPDAAITEAAADITNETDERSKAYLLRTRLTAPLVTAAVTHFVDRLPELAESFELTATVQEAIESVNVGRTDSARVQRRFAVLEISFLAQAFVTFVAAAALVAGVALHAPTIFLAGASALPAIVLHGGYLELKRAMVRWSLTVDLTPGELLRED